MSELPAGAIPVTAGDQLVAGVVVAKRWELAPAPPMQIFEILGDDPQRPRFVLARGPAPGGGELGEHSVAKAYFLPRVPGHPRAWIVDTRWTAADEAAVAALEGS